MISKAIHYGFPLGNLKVVAKSLKDLLESFGSHSASKEI